MATIKLGSPWQRAGAGIGALLGQGLQGYGESILDKLQGEKLQQQKERQSQALSGLDQFRNMSPDQLMGFLSLEPAIQKSIIERLSFDQAEQPQIQQTTALQSLQRPVNQQALQQQTDALRMLKQYGASPEQIQDYMAQNFPQPQEQISQMQQPIGEEKIGKKPSGLSLGLTPQEKQAIEKSKREKEQFEFTKEKETRRQQEKLTPFLQAEAKDFKIQQDIKHTAQDLLNNIKKNYKKFPGAFVGNLPEKARQALIRDPDVRKYMADANKMVILLGQSRKGMPTGWKLRLEQMAKGDISQPIETQIAIWESALEHADQASQRRKFIKSQQDKGGLYPTDIEQRAMDFELAQEDPLSYPEFYKNGTQIEEAGTVYVLRNGEWKEKK